MKIGNFELKNSWIKIGLFVLIGLFFLSTFVSFNNSEVDYRTLFEQKYTERTAAYDKLWKTTAQKAQIAVKVDSSFKEVVLSVMDARKDGQNTMMKWIQESNPTASFDKVQELYKDLSRFLESERTSFMDREAELARIKREHSNLLRKFPNNIYAAILGKKELVYKPITSDRTDDVIKTGKDNDTKVF